MTTPTLKDLLERVETWPRDAQDQAMQSLLSIEQEYVEPYELTEEDRAAIERSLDDMKNGRFATDQDVEGVFSRYRRA